MVGEAIIGERSRDGKRRYRHFDKRAASRLRLADDAPPYLAETDVLARMYHDKKNRSGKLVMVLPTGWGQVDIFPNIPEDAVLDVLRRLKAE